MENFILRILALVPSLLIGVAVHESAHALSASWLGDNTAKNMGRITLNPIKHMDWYTLVFAAIALIPGSGFIIPFKPVMVDHSKLRDPRWDSALTAIAGPFSNLLLAVLFVLVGKVFFIFVSPAMLLTMSHSEWVVNWLADLVVIQFSLFVFNMIPIPPLDGHWVLGAIFPPLERFFETLRASLMGFFIIILLINFSPLGQMLGALYNSANGFLIKIWGLKGYFTN